MRKYFIDCLLAKEQEIIECEITKDGLLLIIPDGPAIREVLSQYDEDDEGWFFNSSHDRYIAEKDFGNINANPQLAWSNGYEIIT